jgi:mono/diheme cytochrome c family protein
MAAVTEALRMAFRAGFALGVVLVAIAGCDSKVAGGKADGAAIFDEVCARCHGPNGIPDRGTAARLGVKPLTSVHVQKQLSDDAIRGQVMNGSANKQMPAFQGALTDAQIDAVIEHVRGLGVHEE